MDRIDVYYDEIGDLERDFARLQTEWQPEGRKVVSRGAFNVKKDWRENWGGHPSIRHLPGTIGYEVYSGKRKISSTIGPKRGRRQAPLAHLIEFGNAEYGTVRNAPVPGGQLALDAEEPRFVSAIATMAERLLTGGRR